MDQDEAHRDGGCLCGAVRYRMTGEPIWTNACHCTDCQRLGGSAFAVNIITEASNVVQLSGEIRTDSVQTASGRPHSIHRCASCGTRVWSNYGTPDVIRFVPAGTLDEPGSAAPDIHIFVRSKLPWVTLPDAVPSTPEFYDVKSHWPAESLDRWRRAIKGA